LTGFLTGFLTGYTSKQSWTIIFEKYKLLIYI